jgi:periplasmic protein TonB
MTFHSLEMRGITTRRLLYAIAASLLLHLLVFWPDHARLLNKEAPALLQATLHLLPQARPAEAVPPQHLPLAAPPAPTLSKPESKPESRPPQSGLEQPKAISVPQTPPAPAAAPSKSAPGASTAPSAPAGSTSGALLTQANASGEAVDGLRGYRLSVATEARRFKRYAAQATVSGLTGSAEIRVEVGSDGRPRPATLFRSSGHELLDQAALAMIDAGAQRARLPESLRGKAFAVVLPVMFNLEDE